MSPTNDSVDPSISIFRLSINQQSHHSAAEHRASTRFLHRTLFLVTHLISAQDIFTLLASSSTVLRHVFFGLPLLRFPWGVPLQGLSGYIISQFPHCMAQPPALAFPDLQIYPWLFHMLPQLIIFFRLQNMIFIVAPCILKSTQFTHQPLHYLLTWLKVLNLH